MSGNVREWCWKCEATVEVYKRRGTIICENCDTPLFDKDGCDILAVAQ
jgi:Zn finger protein HypA/HybF involved in hydrogenase expression